MDDVLKTKDLKFRLNALVSFCLLFRHMMSSYSRLSRRICNESILKNKIIQDLVKLLLKSFSRTYTGSSWSFVDNFSFWGKSA